MTFDSESRKRDDLSLVQALKQLHRETVGKTRRMRNGAPMGSVQKTSTQLRMLMFSDALFSYQCK